MGGMCHEIPFVAGCPPYSPLELDRTKGVLRTGGISMSQQKPAIFFHVALLAILLHFAPAVIADQSHVILGGEDEGEGMVFYPRQVEEGPDGNLYVLDSGDSFIKVFSPTGEYLHKIAGPGEGPGEFQRIDGATFGFMGEDQLFFTEFIGGHHWITIMKLNGDLVRVLSPQLDVVFGVEAAKPLEDGGFLLQLWYNSRPRAKGDYYLYDTPQSLTRVDSLGVIVSEVVRTDATQLISYSPNGGTTNLPWTPVFAWAVTDKNEVIWSDGMDPRMRVFNFAGQPVREMETPLPTPVEVSKKDLQEWQEYREELMKSRNPVWWDRFGRVVEEYDEPIYDKPILRRISITPDGNLLVEGPSYSDSGGSKYWLLDERGEELNSVTVSAWAMHLSDHHLLFFTEGEEGSTLIHAVERPVDETEALAKFHEVAGSMED